MFPRFSGSIMVMTDHLKRLGQLVQSRRIALGWDSREKFAEQLTFSYRVVTDLENGKRKLGSGSYRQLENVLKWEPGSVDTVLAGGDPTGNAAHSSGATSTVSATATADGVAGSNESPPAPPVDREAIARLGPIYDAINSSVDSARKHLDTGDVDAAVGQFVSATVLLAFLLRQIGSPMGDAISGAIVHQRGLQLGSTDTPATAEAKMSAGQAAGLLPPLEDGQEQDHDVEDATQPHAPSETNKNQKTPAPPVGPPESYDLAANRGPKGIPDTPSEAELPQVEPDSDD